MRRNRTSGRGGGSKFNLPSGPLLTTHLKDIDLELQLLKRKREMLERQQYVQPFNQVPPPRKFDQQPYAYNQNEPHHSGSNRDFSHLYSDGPQQFRRPFGKKRQSDSGWQHDSFPKRSAGQGQHGANVPGPSPIRNQRPFTGPSPNRNQRPFPGQRQQSKAQPFKNGQGKQSIGQKIANQKQQKPEKKGVANKITKPKAPAPPNKITAKPAPERNELVAAAIKSVAEVEIRDREALRLLPDKIPTKQMTGRLELALGAILKEINDRSADSPHADSLRAAALQRVMKQAIRERIRSAMLGKIVGATQEIIKEYRDMFPKESDIEIINKALELAGLEPEKVTGLKPIEKEKPDVYYKENMYKLIDSHLNEMFDKLEEIYNPPNENIGESPEIDFTEDVVDPVNQVKAQDPANGEDTAKEQDVPKEQDTPIEQNEAKTEETAKDQEAVQEEDAVKKEDTAKEQQANEVDEAALAAVANTKKGNFNLQQYKRMLPRLLKRYIPTILKMLHLNKMYRDTVADIEATTRAKFVEYGNPDESANTRKNTASAAQTPNQNQPRPLLPFYVKVMGKPLLPKKKLMQAFLEVFNPKSIKRHRSLQNLLFIGFTDKNDFDGIVKANGTVIGRSILSIRVCDSNAGKSVDNLKTEPASENDIIGADLDGQITDLLSSIRSAEESREATEGTAVNGETIVAENEITSSVDNVNNDVQLIEEPNDEVVQVSEPAQISEETENSESTEAQNAPEADNQDDSSKTTPVEVPGEEKNDAVAELKNAVSGRSTPTRASTRIANTPATPSSIRTRRASRLVNNN